MLYRSKKGFTLIELLLVIALIGILGGVVISVLNIPGIQGKSRDSQRISDLRRIQIALSLRYADTRGYPLTGNLGVLAPNYLDVMPTDPDTGGDYCYASDDGTVYLLAAAMEVPTSADASPCSDLNVWAPPLSTGCAAGLANCYGVESP